MKKKYLARIGAPFKKGEAQEYGERLEEIGKRQDLTPENIVKDGKKKTSPFNTYFEWNDTVAVKKHRLQQARELVSGIVEVVVIEGRATEQRSFFNVRNGTDTKYVTLQKAISNKTYRRQLLNNLIAHLENTTELMKMFRSQ